MRYSGGEEVLVGDIWSDYAPGRVEHQDRQWETIAIEDNILHYQCLFVDVRSRTYGASGLSLVRRKGPVVRKKTGFGTFITRIEGDRDAA